MTKHAKAACIFMMASVVLPGLVAAASDNKLRMATENEIRQHLSQADSLKERTDGYQYREGDSTGYKITDGKICARKGNAVDCADVYFDGTRLEMIDRKGNRDFIDN